MATVTLTPFNALVGFSVGTDEFTPALAEARFASAAGATSEFVDITGKVTKFASESGYDLNLNYAQDWATAGSLAHFLLAHNGEEATVTLQVPGGSFEAKVTCVSGDIGGTGNAVATASVVLPVKSGPDFTASGS